VQNLVGSSRVLRTPGSTIVALSRGPVDSARFVMLDVARMPMKSSKALHQTTNAFSLRWHREILPRRNRTAEVVSDRHLAMQPQSFCIFVNLVAGLGGE